MIESKANRESKNQRYCTWETSKEDRKTDGDKVEEKTERKKEIGCFGPQKVPRKCLYKNKSNMCKRVPF